MAGLGFKDFAVGGVLTAADVDGYLMQQSVMRFADAGARGSALGTAVGTGVPLAEGMVSYLDDQNRIEVYTGTGWKPAGTVLQVVQNVKTDAFSASIASGSTAAVTGLTATITPSFASSKVLVIVEAQVGLSKSAETISVILTRGGTALAGATGDAAGSRTRVSSSAHSDGDYSISTVVVSYLDSPGTVSATTYGIDAHHQAATTQTFYLNRSHLDTDSNRFVRAASSITAIEVAA